MTLQGQARPAGGERAPAWSRCSNMSLCQIDGTTHDSSTTPHRKTTTRTTTPPDPAPDLPRPCPPPQSVQAGNGTSPPTGDRRATAPPAGTKKGQVEVTVRMVGQACAQAGARAGARAGETGLVQRECGWGGCGDGGSDEPGGRAGRARRPRGRARSGVRVGVPAEWWSNEFAAHRRPGRGGGSQSGDGLWSGDNPAEW